MTFERKKINSKVDEVLYLWGKWFEIWSRIYNVECSDFFLYINVLIGINVGIIVIDELFLQIRELEERYYETEITR